MAGSEPELERACFATLSLRPGLPGYHDSWVNVNQSRMNIGLCTRHAPTSNVLDVHRQRLYANRKVPRIARAAIKTVYDCEVLTRSTKCRRECEARKLFLREIQRAGYKDNVEATAWNALKSRGRPKLRLNAPLSCNCEKELLG